jgi:hypothetical protein
LRDPDRIGLELGIGGRGPYGSDRGINRHLFSCPAACVSDRGS